MLADGSAGGSRNLPFSAGWLSFTDRWDGWLKKDGLQLPAERRSGRAWGPGITPDLYRSSSYLQTWPFCQPWARLPDQFPRVGLCPLVDALTLSSRADLATHRHVSLRLAHVSQCRASRAFSDLPEGTRRPDTTRQTLALGHPQYCNPEEAPLNTRPKRLVPPSHPIPSNRATTPKSHPPLPA